MTDESKGARRGPPMWIVIGFLLAFGATVVTVVLTGLYVRAPRSGSQDEGVTSVQDERPGPIRDERAVPVQ